ncbi:Tetratricopeptide repeat-containing protein [Muriicola jejuensis]|uniref:Tetratricopeptide repeat protein n=1 Tax=Muriicola jejuensis TaxID=504488 RepID=A0A6P0UEN8_9FLAO|nr:tetratricopeptide repeat protein [Muriicola jejuensis]NER11705.1 tetratricopeptide repeat protein [Muriicola jejuensis]SMP25371.1 Tetratricopeptide repeat-containing protein [Muriicola jejuensis]
MRIITILFILCFGYSVPGNAQNMLPIDSLLSAYNAQDPDTLKVRTINHIVNYYMYRDPEKAKQFAHEELDLSLKLDYKSGISLANYQLGIVHNNMDQIDSARFYYTSSLQLAKRINEKIYISQAQRGLAILEFSQGNLAAADSINDLDLEFTIREKDSTGTALAYDFKGTINQNRGYYSIALANVLKGLKLFELLRDSIRIADCYNHLATLEHNLGNHQMAIDYNTKALSIYEDYDDTYYQAQALNDIGVMYMTLKNENEAISFFEKSIEKSRKAKVQSLEAAALTNLGSTYLQMNAVPQAIEKLNQSIALSETIKAYRRIAIAKNKLAEAFLEMGNPEKAQTLSQEVQAYASETENKSILSEALKLNSQANEDSGNYRRALEMHKSYAQLSDSLLDSEKMKKIEELRIIFQTEKKEAEIALQREEINTLNAKAKIDQLNKGLYAGGMASALALFGLSVFGFRQRLKKNRIAREKQEAIYRQEIAHKKKELASQTLHLVQKNTFIQELKENLESIKNSPEKFKMEFRRIVMLLKKENASDKDWEVFKTYFAEVHNDFDQKLKTLYSDISEKEIRLAAFLRMNLTTKEIAATMNVLPDSILKSKYRLKKKLGLGKEVDLNSFLSSI